MYLISDSPDLIFVAFGFVMFLLLGCGGVLYIAEWQHDRHAAACAQQGDQLYCQPAYKSQVCFCQRPDGALVPIPELLE